MIGEKSMDNRMKTTIDKLEKYASTTPSKWREALEYRQENKIWLRYSQRIAMLMLDKMDELGINQKQLAEMMNCSQQYISKVLKGRENLSLETLYKIEMTLGISILKENFNAGKLLQIAE
jgi:transcriptional regulator with XRE-family HTH domain